MKKYLKLALTVLAAVQILSLCAFSLEQAPVMDEITYSGKALCDYASVPEKPMITGKYAYCINLDTGTVIYEKNSTDKAYPASTVKLLTALTAYENIPDLDAAVTVSQETVRNASGSNMSLKTGEILTARDLLYGVLVTGANDAASALAEYVSGSVSEFCTLMNQKAEQLGAENSHFENVTGFQSENTYSTARDMAIIARAVYYCDELFDMTNTARYTVEPTNMTNVKRTLLNRNTLISRVRSQSDFYKGAEGMSLGGTPEGGQCAVSSFTTGDNLTYLCVVLGSQETDEKNLACSDISEIFDFCKDNFSLQTVASSGDVVCEIKVTLASDTDHVTLFPAQDIKVLLPNQLEYEKDITVERRVYSESAKAPVYKGDEFGEIVVLYKSDVTVGRTKLISGTSVDRSNLLYFFSRVESFIFSTWFKVFLGAAAVLYVIYLALYFKFSKQNDSRRNGRRKL